MDRTLNPPGRLNLGNTAPGRGGVGRWQAIVIAAFVLVLPIAAGAQVRLRAALARNDTLRYDLHAVLTIDTAGKDPDRLEQTARIRMTVADVDRDGNATLRMAFETLAAKRHTQDGDSEYPGEEKGSPAADSPLAKTYSELAGSILELEVSAEGEIGSVAGMDAALRAAHDAGVEEPSRVLGALSPEALAGTLAPLFALDRSGGERKAGDSWTESRPLDLVDPYTARVGTRFTLKSVKDNIADLAGPVTVALRARSEPDATPRLSIAEQSGSSTARWDGKASRLLSLTLEQRVVWKATLELKEPMEATRTTTTRIELKAVQ